MDGIVLDGGRHLKTGLLEAEAHSACPSEQVYAKRPLTVPLH